MIKAKANHLIAGADQLAAQVLVHHQLGHLFNRGGAQGAVHQLTEPAAAAHLLQLAGVREPGHHRRQVGGLALAVQHQGGAEDLPVGTGVEGFRLQHISDPADGIGIEQDAAKDHFLGF